MGYQARPVGGVNARVSPLSDGSLPIVSEHSSTGKEQDSEREIRPEVFRAGLRSASAFAQRVVVHLASTHASGHESDTKANQEASRQAGPHDGAQEGAR